MEEGRGIRKCTGGCPRHEDLISAALRCLRASISCLVIRVPRRTSQWTKNGCEKLDLIPITCGGI